MYLMYLTQVAGKVYLIDGLEKERKGKGKEGLGKHKVPTYSTSYMYNNVPRQVVLVLLGRQKLKRDLT